MKKKHKKLTAVFLGLALLLFASSFCLDALMLTSKAQAFVVTENMHQMASEGRGLEGEQIGLDSHTAATEHMLPCCDVKTYKSFAIENAKQDGKVVVAALSAMEFDLQSLATNKKGIKLDSLTAPPEEGLLSSVIKKE